MQTTDHVDDQATVAGEFGIELNIEELEAILAPLTPSIPIPPPLR